MKYIALHILDIIQNSIVAGATEIGISIEENDLIDSLLITITDNGKGMSEEMVGMVSDPYTTSRTTRKVGLGIPLLKQNAERTGGRLKVDSKLGNGTTIIAEFRPKNIDCLPLGDVGGVIAITVSANPGIDFSYQHSINGNSYSFNTKEVKKILGDTPISNPSISKYLKEIINENLEELKIGTIGY